MFPLLLAMKESERENEKKQKEKSVFLRLRPLLTVQKCATEGEKKNLILFYLLPLQRQIK